MRWLTVLAVVPLLPAQSPIHERDAFRFLQHATFGPTRAEVQRVRDLGYHFWINEQMGVEWSEFYGYLDEKPLEWSQDYFFQMALNGRDQLRQRMAFALHKIFVVSGNTVGPADAYLPYYRLFTKHAFGNFFNLLKEVTLNPAMGEYLDMVNNDKTEPGSGKFPNENFARELLQLFTIGLAALNQDGTMKLDAAGNPIPSYTEQDVKEFTRAFTGFTYPAAPGQPVRARNQPRHTGWMAAFEDNHDRGEKRLLNGAVLPPNQSAMDDLDAALRNIFEHPNVGPFIARSLIQQLVTSNPSPAYIFRVAGSFNDNGQGVRGDLSSVIRDILTDPEALNPPSASAGYLTEPVLYTARLMRMVGGTVAEHPVFSDEAAQMGQKILYAPSVFSYFSPFYRVPGRGLTGPEFQLLTSETALRRTNFVAKIVYGGFGNYVKPDISRFVEAASETDRLLGLVDRDLLGGWMTDRLREEIRRAVEAQRGNEGRARTALYLTAASPQFQVIQ